MWVVLLLHQTRERERARGVIELVAKKNESSSGVL
jgi:hypothetical protein